MWTAREAEPPNLQAPELRRFLRNFPATWVPSSSSPAMIASLAALLLFSSRHACLAPHRTPWWPLRAQSMPMPLTNHRQLADRPRMRAESPPTWQTIAWHPRAGRRCGAGGRMLVKCGIAVVRSHGSCPFAGARMRSRPALAGARVA